MSILVFLQSLRQQQKERKQSKEHSILTPISEVTLSYSVPFYNKQKGGMLDIPLSLMANVTCSTINIFSLLFAPYSQKACQHSLACHCLHPHSQAAIFHSPPPVSLFMMSILGYVFCGIPWPPIT